MDSCLYGGLLQVEDGTEGSVRTLPRRVSIYIRRVRNLLPNAAQLYVKLYCGDQDLKTCCLGAGEDGTWTWDELFTLVPNPSSGPEITIKVKWRRGRRMRGSRTLGLLRLTLEDIRQKYKQWEGPLWWDLMPGDGDQHKSGQIEMQVFYGKGSLRGGLRVLCWSWNMGHSCPPPDLSPLLPPGEKQVYDLVVVGVQEAMYDVEEGPERQRSSSGDQGEVEREIEAGTFVQELAKEVLPQMGMKAVAEGVQNPADPKVTELTPHRSSLNGTCVARGRVRHSRHRSCSSDGQISDGGVGALKVVRALGSLPPSNYIRGPLAAAFASYLDWEVLVTNALGPSYWVVKRKSMGSMRVLVLARVDLVPYIQRVKSGLEATGVVNIGPNKGAVAVSLTVDNTRLCFVVSHLAAHQGKSKARNDDYQRICHNLDIDPMDADLLTGHHHVIWLGDLNYRLDYGDQAVSNDDSPTQADWQQLVQDIKDQQFVLLLEKDQLKKEMAAGRAFPGFHEGDIRFAPTFKLLAPKVPGGTLEYNPKRSPAWCDRILWRSALPHRDITCEQYYSVESLNTSDHLPVVGVLQVPLVRLRDETTSPPVPSSPTVMGRRRRPPAPSCDTKLVFYNLSFITDTNMWPEAFEHRQTATVKRVKLWGSCIKSRQMVKRVAKHHCSLPHLVDGDKLLYDLLGPASAPEPWQVFLAPGRAALTLVDESIQVGLDILRRGRSSLSARALLPLYHAVKVGHDGRSHLSCEVMRSGLIVGTLEAEVSVLPVSIPVGSIFRPLTHSPSLIRFSLPVGPMSLREAVSCHAGLVRVDEDNMNNPE